MELNRSAVAILAGLCVAAGAGGAYLATRNTAPVPATSAVGVSDDIPAAVAVEQSETVISEETSPPAPRSNEAGPASRPPTQRLSPARERAVRPAAVNPQPRAIANNDQRPSVPETRTPEAPEVDTHRPAEAEPLIPVEPPAPQFEELVVSADSVIGLEVETSITSERARVEDEVVAHVTRDVRVGDRVAIPAGSKAHGEVALVERGGRLRDRARLGIRFTSVVLADGTRVPLETETIYREGDAPGGESAAKIGGGAIGGAIIGGILGGARGAVIGGSVGAGAGTTAVLAGGRNPATLSSGTPVTVRLAKPTTVTVEK